MQSSPPHGGASVVSAMEDPTPNKMRGPHPLIHQSSLQMAGNKLRRKKSDVGIRPPNMNLSGGGDESVRGSDSGRGGGGHSNNDDDTGSVSMRLTRLNTRSSRLIGTIMVWLKNINKMRTIQVCKAFYTWKFYQPPSMTLSTPRQYHHGSSPHSNSHLLASPGGGGGGISGSTSVTGDAVPPSPSSDQGDISVDGEVITTNAIPFQQQPHGHGHPPPPPPPPHHNQHSLASSSSSSAHAVSSLTEHKQSYLLLFAENEKLREQVHDIRRTSQKVERSIRTHATRSILYTFLKKWSGSRIRYYFDIWFNNNRMLKLVSNTAHKTIELAVGLQQVESEREYVRKTEHSNASLRMLLCLTIYFFKWKSKIANRVLYEERKEYEEQRRVIFKELRKMRELVSFANEQEVAVLHSAMMRGQDATQHLMTVKEKLATIVAQSKNYRSTQITPEMLTNLVASLSMGSDDGSSSILPNGHSGASTSGKHRSGRDKDRNDREDGNGANTGRNASGGNQNNPNGAGNGKGNTERTPDVKRSTRKINANNNNNMQQQSPAGVNGSSPPPPPPPPPIPPLSLQTMGI